MKPSIVVICILLMIVGDIFTSFAYNLNLSFWNIGLFIKTPIELLFLGLMFRYKQFHFIYFVLFALLLFWLIGFSTTLILGNVVWGSQYDANFIVGSNFENSLTASFTVFNRYILFFSLMPMLLAHRENEKFVESCKKVFEGFLYANSIAIIVGFIFKLDFFSSYNPTANDLAYEARFGYKGLLYGINETTGIFFLGVAHAYREIFTNYKRKYALLLLLLISSPLTGAKGCIIAVVLLSSFYLFRYKRILFYSLVVPSILIGIIYLIKIDFIEQVSSLFSIYIGDEFSSSAFGALLTLLMTGRNIYIYNNWSYMVDHWSAVNFLFGDGLLYSETDLFDLFYFFGLGGIIYLLAYIKLTFYVKAHRDLIAVFLFMLLLAFTGGHFIRSAVFPVFFSLYIISGYWQNESKENVSRTINL